jgi:hypothetical protein
MKVLTDNIRKNGFDYKLIERDQNCAIYEQLDKDYDGKIHTVAFEVFIIKKTKDAEIAGNKIEGGEVFPGNEDFGRDAYSYGIFGDREYALKRAYEKYAELQERVKNRLNK